MRRRFSVFDAANLCLPQSLRVALFVSRFEPGVSVHLNHARAYAHRGLSRNSAKFLSFCDDEGMAFESTTLIRVRYAETDAMGIVHHAVYPIWMELGRSDFLRELGQSYAQWERQGVMMSVAELQVTFRAPARYDELVEVRTRLVAANRRKITFAYTILREGTRLVEGRTMHVVTGPDGRARTLPEALLRFVEGAL